MAAILAAQSDAEHYASERRREQVEVRDIPEAETKEGTDVLGAFGVSAEAAAPVVRALKQRPEAWIDFMMRFELGLESRIRNAPSSARSRSPEPTLPAG